ncbi:unnamed protein product, partial [Mesorhabditis belari]|uniref:C2H2-type domain-containing protein n=1 Tax=Mesorhabditis belari TaxID=2138241 RepID=A0AAF3F5X6_9BILA
MSLDGSAESLRRSKRNKFHLDVAGICSSSGRRSANSHLMDLKERDDSSSPHPPTLSPQMADLNESDDDHDDLDEKKRTQRARKIPVRIASCYTHDGNSDEEDDSFLVTGPIGCNKCPMRFGSKSGLSNHARMHGGLDIRMFKCDKCDFSCGTQKASRLHQRSHELVPDWQSSNEASIVDEMTQASTSTTTGVKRLSDGTILAQQDKKQGSSESNEDAPTIPNITRKITSPYAKMFKLSQLAESKGARLGNAGKSMQSVRNNRILLPNNKIASMNRQSSSNGVRQAILSSLQETPPQTSVGAALKSHFGLNKYRHSLPANLDVLETAQKKKEDAKDKRRYKCQLCPFTSHVNQRLQHHKDAHNRVDGHQCPHCSYRNESAGLIKRHISLHTNTDCLTKDENTMDSEDSNGKFNHIGENLIESIEENKALLKPRSATRRMNGVITCPSSNCNFVCRFANELIRHKRLVHGVKLSSKTGYECAMCAIKFATFGQRMIHLRTTRHHKPHFNPKIARKFLKEIIGNGLYKANVNDLPKIARVDVKEEKVESQAEQLKCAKMEVGNEQKEEMPKIVPEQLEPTTPSTGDVKEEILDEEMAKDQGARSAGSLQATLPCKQCPYLASSKSRLKRHEGKHLIKSENQCPQCTFSCRGDDLLATHIRLHKSDSVKIEVQNDNASSNSQTPPKLENEKTNISLESIAAEVSDERMDEDQEATQNERIARETQQEEPNTTTTTDGETNSQDASSSAKKLRFVDKDGVRRERCPECPYTTKHFCDMKAHRAMHGCVKREHSCPYCSYSTKRFMSLRTHVKLHGKKIKDPMERLHVCKQIDVIHPVFGLIGYRRTGIGATKQRRYMCDMCPFIAHYSHQLWQHARRHLCPSRDAIQCSTCNYASVFTERLEFHETLHPKQQKENAETPQTSAGLINNGLAHVCNECPFATDTYGRLWNHKEKHKKPSKFNCEHCTFSTGSLTSLHQHTQLHGAQKFECRIAGCSHNEVTYEGMQKHYETRHSTSLTGLRKRSLLADVCLERLENGNGVNTPKSSKSSQSPDLLGRATSDVKNELKRESQSPPDLGLPFTMPDPALVVKYMRKNLPPYLRNLKLSKSSSDSATPESSLSSSSAMMRCSDLDCPYEDDDPTLYRLHADMHGPGKRPMACTMCTYSCFAPEALYNHLDLHTAGHDIFKKITSASARRLARESEIIMEGAPVYSCIHCSYRTQFLEKFKQHRIEHAVSQQNRLKALVKRNAQNQEDDWTKPRLRSLNRKSDRELYCPKCGFYCISKLSYDKHVQMHGTAGYFICKLCDYSSNTYNVVHFHEINHHLDQPLTHLTKAAILNPETSKIRAATTTEDRVRLAGQEVRCNRCDWRGCEVSALSAHFSSEHGVTVEDQEAALFLYLGLFPKGSVLTPTSA